MRHSHRRAVLAVLAIALGVAIQLGLAPVAGAKDLPAAHGPQIEQ
jgi:hypothetical protein